MMLVLPTEVLCGCILPHLSVFDLQALDTAFTNKYLRPQLRQVWKCYQHDSANTMLKAGDVSWLCGVGVHIISLTVNNDTELDAFVTSIPTLKKLRIGEYIRSTVLESLAAHCLDLEELYVNYMYGSNIDNAVSALAQNCRQLHTLRITSNRELTDVGLSSLARYGKQLHTLCIDDAVITDAGIQALCDTCPHLKHIELSNCYNLTDASPIAIANSYPHLESVRLHSDNFTDDGLIYFADKCHELRSVSVRCYNITSRGLTALWAANPNLLDVNVSRKLVLSNNDTYQLVQCCPLLQKLNISNCQHITDAAVVAVAEHCPQLRSLDISSSYDLSDASLFALGQHCHELISINISWLKNISDVGIAALAAGCPLLREFTAIKTNITDAGVIALARGCRDLHKIDMRECTLISFVAVSAIAENCPLISVLDLSFSAKVDDACLRVIAQHCHNLTVLNVFSTAITDTSVLKSGRMPRVIWSCCL